MAIELFGHPFSAYTIKALIPLYENATAFIFRILSPEHPENATAFAPLSPMGKFPILVDAGRAVYESTSVIEHLDLHHPGPVEMIPIAADAALAVRTLDRMFDNYVMAPTQAIVDDALRPSEIGGDPWGVLRARSRLDAAYAWLDSELAERVWAAGEDFSLADCAAAPALLYAHWVHPIPDAFEALRAYRTRLLARPSVARCVEEARPYRALFPLPVPADD